MHTSISSWKLLLFFPFFMGHFPAVQAQVLKLDSLRNVMRGTPDDTSRVKLYYEYGDALASVMPDSALWYYDLAKTRSMALDHDKGSAAYASHALVILNNQGKFREALEISKEALERYLELGDEREIAIAYINVGSEWQYLADFQLAADNYLKAMKIGETIGDQRLQRITNNNLASIFINLKEYEKGKQFAERSLVMAKALKDSYSIASSTYNIATAELYLKEYDLALAHYSEVGKMGKRSQDFILILDGWLGAGDVYNAQNVTEHAVFYYDSVIDLSRQKKAPEYEMYAYMGLSELKDKNTNYSEAEQYALKGIALAKRLGSNYELKDLFKRMAEVAEKSGAYQKALEYRKEFEVLNDSIIGENSRSNINLLEAKFESEKKESRIVKLEAAQKIQELSLQQKNTLNTVLVGASAALLLLSLLFYRNHMHKQRLQQQRIGELEKEKQLMATEAILKGEERERMRLAKDLHDGLGGMLSGIKYSFQHLKGNQIMTPESQRSFDRGMDMLDSSILEMRRVAHNMMPESLVKFGLDSALKDFCNEITKSGALMVNYQSFHLEDMALEQTFAINIYRIVQELINNTLKHASAKRAIVQLSYSGDLLSLTVEDDGRGFNTDLIYATSGMGWRNIEHRIELLKGKLDINSHNDNGTSVHIEFRI
ncbi:MAG: tetratricopeptide repeat protein [Flavobacteriales bacterium]|nr:MAG: tetratricopeptide repeat protein [Flavobacteriales bacterium]